MTDLLTFERVVVVIAVVQEGAGITKPAEKISISE